jgi:hypothetical protein
MSRRIFLIFVPVVLLAALCAAQEERGFLGSWELLPAKSTEIDLYGVLSLRFKQAGPTVELIQTWGKGRTFTDSLLLRTGDAINPVPVTDRVFPSNVFMGLKMPVGTARRIAARWEDNGRALALEERFDVRGSQGPAPVHVLHRYALSSDGNELTYTVRRSTRMTGPVITYTFKPAGSKQAYFIRLEDNWEIDGKLPEQAFLISLQGIANVDGPVMYILYPQNWPFTYVHSVFDYYRDKRNYSFTDLKSAPSALATLKRYVRGYVVWDKNVRTSLIVAFTVSGLERAVAVSEDLIPLVEKEGLKPVEDFRGKFTGWTDAQIYQWAYDRYWARCNKEFIVWLGGEHGTMMKPGVADWGVYKKVFFNDLSSRPSDSLEYALANRLLREMKPMSMVMGWHSYAKDLEREHLTMTSRYGHRVEGLHTLPNLSFSAQVPATKGFVYRNNHHLVPGKDYTPGNRVYITCIQTDGIGLGAWLKPGRGEIPYAWEVLMNYTWMAPAMAEYFYTMATRNDYFIGCLSGPGYLYPKVVPPNLLTKLIAMANEQMKVLDLKVFETMDYSQGATVEGNTELPKDVLDAYYSGMPDAIGFVNGYAPSHTFTVRDGRPFVSYDYYLSPTRPEADAVSDLEELARINAKRPYFLLIHVRESSDIKRVKGILDRLGPEFEQVPLDIFLTMAGKSPTFKEQLLERH